VSAVLYTLEDALHGHVAHGPDERRLVRWVPAGVRYLREIVLRLAD
jgi:hypothetical protein